MAKRAPKITFRDSDPLQDYYVCKEGNHYSVARLVDETKHLKPFDVPLAALDMSYLTWDKECMFGIAFHVKKVMDADLSHPIILDWRGVIADGRHRVIKAIIEGRRTIKAVRMTWRIPADKEAQADG